MHIHRPVSSHRGISRIAALCLLCLFCCAALTACGGNGAGPAENSAASNASETAYTFTDAMGQEITVDRPQRVVALMGSFAEIWMLAGGADSLVGVTSDAYDNRPFELPADVSVVGTFQDPSMESILALEPDLVLLSAETAGSDSHVALKDALAEAGVTAAYFSVTHFEDYLAMLQTCAAITGDTEAYQTNGEAVAQRIDRIVAENRLETPPSVLLMITYSGGIRPQNSDTMTGKMLADLGCKNIADENPSLLKDFSVESIIAADPDYIFVIPMGNDDALAVRNLQENVESDPAWSSLSAVRNGRYILLSKQQFLYKPNAAWDESYAELARLLHGASPETQDPAAEASHA